MSRNSSGTYSLYTPGNPVVTSTVISSTWANNTLSDLATAITDSLSRSGDGGMLAPLELDNGTIGAPGLTWGVELTSGFRRAAAGDFRFAIGGVDVLTITAAGISSLNFTGFANPTGTIGLSAVNGSATTAMRSDAAPVLSQAITPTWSGVHAFSSTSGGGAVRLTSASPGLTWNESDAAADAQVWRMRVNSSGFTFAALNDALSVER